MKARVTTTIDGTVWKLTGILSKDKTKLTYDKNKSLFILIKPEDTIELIEPKPRIKHEVIKCPFDIVNWLHKSKQIRD